MQHRYNYLRLIKMGGNFWDAWNQNELTRSACYTKKCCYHSVHSIQEPNVIWFPDLIRLVAWRLPQARGPAASNKIFQIKAAVTKALLRGKQYLFRLFTSKFNKFLPAFRRFIFFFAQWKERGGKWFQTGNRYTEEVKHKRFPAI